MIPKLDNIINFHRIKQEPRAFDYNRKGPVIDWPHFNGVNKLCNFGMCKYLRKYLFYLHWENVLFIGYLLWTLEWTCVRGYTFVTKLNQIFH